MANYDNQNTDSEKSYHNSFWQWFLLYIVIGIVVYGLIYNHQSKIAVQTPKRPVVKTIIQRQVLVPTTNATTSATEAKVVTNSVYMSKNNPTLTGYMADLKGMTLYIFDKDKIGVSNCYSDCATAWPPYLIGKIVPSTLPANVTIVKRTDGTSQFAWKGMPLYYYVKDAKVGDVLGDGVAGIWHIIKL